MDFYKEVDTNHYCWYGFYLARGIEVDSDCIADKEEQFGTAKVRKKIACGIGLNILEEQEQLNMCRRVRVFTKEIEFALLSGAETSYSYRAKNKAEVNIRQLDVIGDYIYITPEEVCSGRDIGEDTMYMDDGFILFRKYVLEGQTDINNFHVTYDGEKDYFKIVYENDGTETVILEITDGGVDVTYGFVLYLLRRYCDNPNECGANESGFTIRRIKNTIRKE